MKRNFFGWLTFLLAATFVAAQSPPGPTVTTQLQQPLQTLPAPVSSAAVFVVGNPGPQTIYYWIVANYLVGSSSPAGPFTVINAPNSLSVSNYVNVSPTYPSGIISVDVLKTSTNAPPLGACNCAVATAVTSGSVADQSNSTLSYTVGPVDVNALTLTLQNEPTANNQSHEILRQNGKFVTDLSVAHGSNPPSGPAGGDLYGTYPNPFVGGINQVPLCTGFAPLNGYGLQYTTGSSPNPCYTAAPFNGLVNPMTTLGDMIGGSTGGTPTRIPGPTAPNGVTQVVASQPASSLATFPAYSLPGIVGRSVTGATDTIGSADCNPYRVVYTGSSAVAVALPTPTTLQVPFCTVKLANNTSNTVTITPATWTISAGSGGTPGATLQLLEGQEAILFADPATSNNWAADVVEQGLSAGAGTTFTRSPTGLQIATNGGGGTITGLTTPKIPKATSSTSVGDSSLTDDGSNPVASPDGLDVLSSGWYGWRAPNNTSTGTVINKLACDDGAGKAIICSHTTSTLNVPLGVAVNGAGGAAPGTSGNTGICLLGFCTVVFANGATANHFAQEDATADGELSDVGSTAPTNGQPYYLIFAGNAGAGTKAVIRDLTPNELSAASSGGGGSKNAFQVNGTAVPAGDVLNVNSTTPVAGANNLNVTVQSSRSGKTTSVSAGVPYAAPLGVVGGNLTCATCVTNVTGTGPVASSGGTTPAISINTNGITATQLAAQYSKLRCEAGLGDGVNAMTAATYSQFTCVNDSGVTWTITGIHCWTDNAGTSTLQAANNAGTNLLTSAVTCNNTKASGGAAGTQSATTTLASGDAITFSFVADGTSKQANWTVSLTQ